MQSLFADSVGMLGSEVMSLHHRTSVLPTRLSHRVDQGEPRGSRDGREGSRTLRYFPQKRLPGDPNMWRELLDQDANLQGCFLEGTWEPGAPLQSASQDTVTLHREDVFGTGVSKTPREVTEP